MAEKSQMPVVAQLRFIFLKYVGNSERSDAKKQSDLEIWQLGIAAVARHSGFRRLTHAELSKAPFHNEGEMRDLMMQHSPFGTRGMIQRQMGKRIDFLLRGEDDDDCGQAVEILSMMPVDGVKEDYGAFGIMSFAIGCDDEQKTRHDLRKLLDEMTQYLATKGNSQ